MNSEWACGKFEMSKVTEKCVLPATGDSTSSFITSYILSSSLIIPHLVSSSRVYVPVTARGLCEYWQTRAHVTCSVACSASGAAAPFQAPTAAYKQRLKPAFCLFKGLFFFFFLCRVSVGTLSKVENWVDNVRSKVYFRSVCKSVKEYYLKGIYLQEGGIVLNLYLIFYIYNLLQFILRPDLLQTEGAVYIYM